MQDPFVSFYFAAISSSFLRCYLSELSMLSCKDFSKLGLVYERDGAGQKELGA